ncbi:unnamed protein product [Trichogramma brassicae]|uniref:Uncharacterized protein n=1 Tax=Trichogramma brassicae TaxID=86971 RepID=A0A6H5I7L6_9HYME|nr:unnamed protein product [Trichogramma brassicae]
MLISNEKCIFVGMCWSWSAMARSWHRCREKKVAHGESERKRSYLATGCYIRIVHNGSCGSCIYRVARSVTSPIECMCTRSAAAEKERRGWTCFSITRSTQQQQQLFGEIPQRFQRHSSAAI